MEFLKHTVDLLIAETVQSRWNLSENSQNQDIKWLELQQFPFNSIFFAFKSWRCTLVKFTWIDDSESSCTCRIYIRIHSLKSFSRFVVVEEFKFVSCVGSIIWWKVLFWVINFQACETKHVWESKCMIGLSRGNVDMAWKLCQGTKCSMERIIR